jgi:hypothetical protein
VGKQYASTKLFVGDKPVKLTPTYTTNKQPAESLKVLGITCGNDESIHKTLQCRGQTPTKNKRNHQPAKTMNAGLRPARDRPESKQKLSTWLFLGGKAARLALTNM